MSNTFKTQKKTQRKSVAFSRVRELTSISLGSEDTEEPGKDDGTTDIHKKPMENWKLGLEIDLLDNKFLFGYSNLFVSDLISKGLIPRSLLR